MIFWLFLVFHHAPQNQTYRCSSDIKLNALIFMLPWAIVTCLLVLITNVHLYASSPSTDLELFQVALHSAHSLSSERRAMLSSANVPNDLLMGTLSAIFTFRSINDSSAKPPIFFWLPSEQDTAISRTIVRYPQGCSTTTQRCLFPIFFIFPFL